MDLEKTEKEKARDLVEIDLFGFLVILWKNKWFITIITFLCVGLAVGLSFLFPNKWEITAIFQPSKFTVQTEQGSFEEVLVSSPYQVAQQVNEEAFNQVIANQLNLSLEDLPEIKAKALRNTNLIRFSLETSDLTIGEEILNTLYLNLKRELDKKIDVEIQNIETQKKEIENEIELVDINIRDIKNSIDEKKNEIQKKKVNIEINKVEMKKLAIEKTRLQQEIDSLKRKMDLSKERINSIIEEMKEVKKRIDDIAEQQKEVLNSMQKTTETNSLSLLLYSNEIQQNLRYYNTLDEKLINEKKALENYKYEIKDLEERIKSLERDIELIGLQNDTIEAEIKNLELVIKNLNNKIDKEENKKDTLHNQLLFLEDKKNRIDYTQMIKQPTPSLNPVFPNRKLIALLSFLIGLAGSVMVVVIRDSLRRVKTTVD